jgi:hypothetical protein
LHTETIDQTRNTYVEPSTASPMEKQANEGVYVDLFRNMHTRGWSKIEDGKTYISDKELADGISGEAGRPPAPRPVGVDPAFLRPPLERTGRACLWCCQRSDNGERQSGESG